MRGLEGVRCVADDVLIWAAQTMNMIRGYAFFYNAAVKLELLSTKTSAVLDCKKFHLWVTW